MVSEDLRDKAEDATLDVSNRASQQPNQTCVTLVEKACQARFHNSRFLVRE
jgi:hypothetical protein